jgi:hypothetical protein
VAADVGWVYRDAETPTAIQIDTVAKDIVAAEIAEIHTDPAALTVVRRGERETPPVPAVHPSPGPARLAVMAGIGAFAFGVLTTGLASLALLGMMTGPVFAARRFLRPR